VSEYRSFRPAVSIWKPTIGAGTYAPAGTFLETMQDELTAYQHTVQATGGFWQATLTVTANLDRAEDWLSGGLGRHIIVTDDALNVVFEGFVNKVDARVGGFSVTRGPLMDVFNQGVVVYAQADYTTTPPTMGGRYRTAVNNHAASQLLYGVVQKVYSGGGMTDAEALQLRDTFLAEQALPETSKQWSSGGGELSLTVEVYGYVRWLEQVFYSYTAGTGGYNLSTKLADVLDYEPNNIFASANAAITANTTQVERYEDSDRSCWAIVKSLVAAGDSTYNRYVFTCYAGRFVTYAPAPTTVEYQQLLADPEQRVVTLQGAPVEPWNVLPGKWLFFPDFLVGRVRPDTALANDPRALFIEAVTYTMPRMLQVDGSRWGSIQQRLGLMGLRGVGP